MARLIKEYNLKFRAYRARVEADYYKYLMAEDEFLVLKNKLDAKRWESIEETMDLNRLRIKAKVCKRTLIGKIENHEERYVAPEKLYTNKFPKPPIYLVILDFLYEIRNFIRLEWHASDIVWVRTQFKNYAPPVVGAFMTVYGSIFCWEYAKATYYRILEHGFEYVVKGTVTHNTDSAKMMYMGFLDKEDPLGSLTIDSTAIVDGKFTFKGHTYYPARTYISTDLYSVSNVSPEKTSILYIAPRNEISCVINLKNPKDSIKVYNSPADEDYRYVIKSMKPIDALRSNLFTKVNYAYEIGDTIQIAKLKEDLYIINREYSTEWFNILLSLDKTSAMVLDDYISLLFNNEYLTNEQFIQIEKRFNELPFYIKDCKSGKRVSKMIMKNKGYFNEKD